MNSPDRDFYLRLAWFAPDSSVLGETTRPLSLASMEAMRLMGLSLLEAEPGALAAAAETREIATWLWLHTEEIPVIERALWDGSWAAIPAAQDEPLPALIDEWRALRERLRALIEAAAITIVPKPKSSHDDTPWNVVGPCDLAFKLSLIARATGWPRRDILWRLPVYQALQIYHAELRWSGLWTVRPGEAVAPAEFEGFTIPGVDAPADSGAATDGLPTKP